MAVFMLQGQNSRHEILRPQSLKYLLSGPLQKKFGTPIKSHTIFLSKWLPDWALSSFKAGVTFYSSLYFQLWYSAGGHLIHIWWTHAFILLSLGQPSRYLWIALLLPTQSSLLQANHPAIPILCVTLWDMTNPGLVSLYMCVFKLWCYLWNLWKMCRLLEHTIFT